MKVENGFLLLGIIKGTARFYDFINYFVEHFRRDEPISIESLTESISIKYDNFIDNAGISPVYLMSK